MLRIVRHSHVPNSQHCALGPASGLILEPSSLIDCTRKDQPRIPSHNNRGSCLRRGLTVTTKDPGKRERAAVHSFRSPDKADVRKR